MKLFWVALLLIQLATIAGAQDNALLTVVRGSVTSWTPMAGGKGLFTVRTVDYRTEQCSYDTSTFFARLGQKASLPGDLGERVEVICDRNGHAECFARTIRTWQMPTTTLPARSSYSSYLDSMLPRGNLVLSGIVTAVDDKLTLRTRKGEEMVLRLREDTRFLSSGVAGKKADLALNTTVFVRAGRNFENVLEAYQVVWGSILKVEP